MDLADFILRVLVAAWVAWAVSGALLLWPRRGGRR
jgi:hypothetical protein